MGYLWEVLKSTMYEGTILGGPDEEGAMPILAFPLRYPKGGIFEVEDPENVSFGTRLHAWSWWAIANILGLSGALSVMKVPKDKVSFKADGETRNVISDTIYGRITANGDRQPKPEIIYFRAPRFLPPAEAKPPEEGALPGYVLGRSTPMQYRKFAFTH